MNRELHLPQKVIRTFFIIPLLTVGLSELQLRKVQSQGIWETIDSPKAQPTPVLTENSTDNSEKSDNNKVNWEQVPVQKNQNQPSSNVLWEVIENEDEALIPPLNKESNSKLIPPDNLDEAEELFKIIPLQSSDFNAFLNLSYAVPTASVLRKEEQLIASTINPFEYGSGTRNINYAIQLDYGLSETFLISGFYSEANYRVNGQIQILKFMRERMGSLWGSSTLAVS